MPEPAYQVQGTDVFVEGEGAETLVFIHGWPDTHFLWDSTVRALQGKYRCVRFTFPGYAAAQTGTARTLVETTALLLAIVDAASPQKPVTLVLHDWGCVFGYELAARHPLRIKRIVGVDIGDHNSGAFAKSLLVSQKLAVLSYQVWLAMGWLAGRFLSPLLGSAMTRLMARLLECPTPAGQIHWFMNVPYAMTWFGLGGGLAGSLQVEPHCPMLYVYGRRKPLMFHSPRWLERINARPDSKAVGLPCGHWVMVSQAAAFEALVLEWLDGHLSVELVD